MVKSYYLCSRVTYTERVIKDGREHYDEGRQTADLKQESTDWEAFPALARSELSAPIWSILAASDQDLVLKLKVGPLIRRLAFATKDEAALMQYWLEQKSPRVIGKRQLQVGLGSSANADDFRPIAGAVRLAVVRSEAARAEGQLDAIERCKTYGPDGSAQEAKN